ncbi:hypothetical protein HNQ43_000357 [Faecalicoccus acidiformans]|uniref:NlpC/P60 domain-containing protein n=1 Tax=Faecalicoccus acidiformans TaxID=915173 RepID=A0A7W8D1J6_9FIRM|nr:hypothetical protein [Faecalicoccus acidiformans]MBB5184322.1 hypothetical protein [Faecalicoccus acidiformans]
MKRHIQWSRVLAIILILILTAGLGLSLFLNRTVDENVSQKDTVAENDKTLQEFLKIAMEPVGQTMYVWGGGWNEEDTGAGIEATTLGLSSQWKIFFEQQSSNYDYQTTLYQIHDGLDCSGYVGWVIYNLMESESGQSGYVMKSQEMASTYASYGWGTFTPYSEVTDHKPGDIFSNEGHVYISLGTCDDGSVLLVHSSPPGVRLCGTLLASGESSKAVELASSIMSTHYPKWFEKYPSCEVDLSYLTNYDQFQWNVDTLSDAQFIQNLSAEEIADLLWS